MARLGKDRLRESGIDFQSGERVREFFTGDGGGVSSYSRKSVPGSCLPALNRAFPVFTLIGKSSERRRKREGKEEINEKPPNESGSRSMRGPQVDSRDPAQNSSVENRVPYKREE